MRIWFANGLAGSLEYMTPLAMVDHDYAELATVLEQEASAASDVETKIGLEKKLAQLHEVKRRDFVAAGDAWSRGGSSGSGRHVGA